jgi:hypothetical protein
MTALSFDDSKINALIVLLDIFGKFRLPTGIHTSNWKGRRRKDAIISKTVVGCRGKTVQQG